MNKKTILTTFVLTAVTASTFAAGLDNTVNPTAAHYGAEAYGYTNTITATGRSAFVAGYNNTVSANNALVYGVGNKAEGINSLVGGEYSKATGRNSVAIGSSAQALQDNTFAIGSQARANGADALAFGNGAYAENTATVAIGKTVKATEEGALAIGFNTEATARDAIAIGGNVKEPGDTLTAQKTTASGRQSIAFGYKANSKGVSGISIGTNAYSEGRGAVSIGSWSIASGDGATAVGGGHARADRAVVVGSGNADGKESVSVGSYSRVYAEGAVGIGRNVFIDDSATNSVVIGSSSETISKKNVTAIGSNTYSEVENSVALGTSARADEVISTSSANIAGKTYNFAGKTADGTVSIGGKIISDYETDRYGMPIFDDNGNMIPIVDKTAYRTITNVAAGRISDTSTDAVNGSQLNAAIKGIDKNHQDIVDTAKGLQMLGDVVADHEVAIAANKQAAADAMEEAKKHTSVVAGDNVVVTTGTNAASGKEYTVSVNKDLTDMNSVGFGKVTDPKHVVATKDGMHVFNGEVNTNYDSNGIKIENTNTLETAKYTMDGMQASDDNATIRFTTTNIDAGNQQIHGVKAGTANTDAVNVSQLKEVGNKVNDNSKRIDTNENRINDLDNKINDVGRNALERANHYTDLQVNKGVAKASALAGLKFLDYNPKDKWSFAASVGHYRNANAVAVGAAYQPNENTMVHGGITVDGEIAYNLGVSFKTGGQKYINKYELAEQVKQLQSNNAELRQELNELRSIIEKK
jgi:hep/hag repeat protein (fragment)